MMMMSQVMLVIQAMMTVMTNIGYGNEDIVILMLVIVTMGTMLLM